MSELESPRSPFDRCLDKQDVVRLALRMNLPVVFDHPKADRIDWSTLGTVEA